MGYIIGMRAATAKPLPILKRVDYMTLSNYESRPAVSITPTTAWKRMLADIEAGKAATVLAKDMSRIGRDYLQTGFYTEV